VNKISILAKKANVIVHSRHRLSIITLRIRQGDPIREITMKKLIIATLTMGLGCLSLMSAQAEVVKLPVGSQAASKQQVERPQNGMPSAQVKARFGEPLNIVPAVGEPPISSWEYADYFVFFEYDTVLHTVLKHVPVPEYTPPE
jgi:hypothetical protein